MSYLCDVLKALGSFGLLGALLASCAGQINIHDSITDAEALGASQGLVVARVINASGYPLPFNQLTLIPDNLNVSKSIKPERIIAKSTVNTGTTVYAAPIAAGTYMIQSIRAFHSQGDFWSSRFVSADNMMGIFEVKAGAVTDLGTLVYYPRSQQDKYFDFLLRVPNTANGEVLRKHFPFYHFDRDSLVSWAEDELDEERMNSYASIAQNPAVYSTRKLLSDGSVAFLAKLGVIIFRDAKGGYRLESVDTNLGLSVIGESENGLLFAGGPEGALFQRGRDGIWTDVSIPNSYAITDIVFGMPGQVDVLAVTDNHLAVLRRNMAAVGNDWQEVNRYSYTKGWTNLPRVNEEKSTKNKISPKRVLGAKTFKIDEKYYVSISVQSLYSNPIMSKGKGTTYQYDPVDWTIQLPMPQPDAVDVVLAGAVTLQVVKPPFWSGTTEPSYYKLNAASGEWEEVSYVLYYENDSNKVHKMTHTVGVDTSYETKSFSFHAAPMFKDDLNGIAVVRLLKNVNWDGVRTYENKLLKTLDGGITWDESGYDLPKPYCAELAPEVAYRLVLSCSGSTSDFYESLDDGASWIHVRQHENF